MAHGSDQRDHLTDHIKTRNQLFAENRQPEWEVFTLPGSIHMESMWNPWNPSPIPCGMIMEWSIPYGIHCYSTWIPLDSIWNLGISTMDSVDKSIWIPWTSPYGFHGTSPYGINGYYIYNVLTILSKKNLHFHRIEAPATTQRTTLKPPEPQRLCYT